MHTHCQQAAGVAEPSARSPQLLGRRHALSRARRFRGEERPSRTESGPLDASWPSGWQPRQQGVGLRSNRDQAPRLARSSVRSRISYIWVATLDDYVERAASLGTREAVRAARAGFEYYSRGAYGAPYGPIMALPILVGRLLVQQWPSNRQLPRRPRRRAAPPPATQLAEQYKGVGGHFVGRFCAHLSATTKLVCPFLPIA